MSMDFWLPPLCSMLFIQVWAAILWALFVPGIRGRYVVATALLGVPWVLAYCVVLIVRPIWKNW